MANAEKKADAASYDSDHDDGESSKERKGSADVNLLARRSSPARNLILIIKGALARTNEADRVVGLGRLRAIGGVLVGPLVYAEAVARAVLGGGDAAVPRLEAVGDRTALEGAGEDLGGRRGLGLGGLGGGFREGVSG